MHRMPSFNRFRTGMGLAVAVALAGCEAPTKRVNTPPQGHTEYPHKAMQAHYTPMVDQAMLADMNMSSIHFVPHQSELNANGIRRLQRYAEILRIYGGTLRYDGFQDDEELAAERIQRIEDYLASAGLSSDQYKVERGLAGGTGMNAHEAMTIRQGTAYTPGGGDGQASAIEQLFNIPAGGQSRR